MAMDLRDFVVHTDYLPQRELFVTCFPDHRGRTQSTHEHFQWKFHSAASVPPSEQFVAVDGQALLGYYAAIPVVYTYGGNRYAGALVCDVMTSPAARGRGVFTFLGRHATQELANRSYDFTTGYPIRKAVIPGHKKVGWQLLFPLLLHVRVLNPGAVLGAMGWIRTGTLISWLQRAVQRMPLPHGMQWADQREYAVYSSDTTAKNWVEELTALSSAYTAEVPIALEKSASFLRWRLGGPDATYDIHFLRHRSENVGYAITRLETRQGIRVVGVIDVFVKEAHRHQSRMLLRTIVSHARALDVDVVTIMASGHQARAYGFIRAGILPTPLRYTFIVKELNRLPAGAADVRNWQLNWIDTDIF
jgi:GNAT superfamily N-acetyltransferase